MKKVKWIMVVAVCVVGSLFAGCQKEEKTIDIDTLSKQILETNLFPEGMVEIEEPMLEKLYGIKSEDITSYYGTISGGATAEEVLLIKAKDEKTLKEIEEKLKARIEERKISFESYAPEEVKKLDQALLKVQKDTLVYCVCAEKAKIENLLK